MGIIKLESYFFQPKKFFFSKYCQNCNRKYCEFHKLYYKFEIISQYKNENVHIRSKPITLQNWKIKIQEWWNFTAKIERYKLFDLIPRKLCTIFVVAYKDLTSFFFSFFHTSRIPREVRPAGLRVLHLYVLLIDPCPAASSTCGDEKAAHGQRHGRGERAHAEYREWKPRAPLAGWNGAGTRNQGLHLPAANYPAWKKLRTEQPVPLTFLPSSTLFLALFSNSTASFQISPRFRALHRISERMNKDLSFMGGGIKMKPSTEVVFCVDLRTRKRVSLLINSSKREI